MYQQIPLCGISMYNRCNDCDHIFFKIIVICSDFILCAANFCRVKIFNRSRCCRISVGMCGSDHITFPVYEPDCTVQMRFHSNKLCMDSTFIHLSKEIMWQILICHQVRFLINIRSQIPFKRFFCQCSCKRCYCEQTHEPENHIYDDKF